MAKVPYFGSLPSAMNTLGVDGPLAEGSGPWRAQRPGTEDGECSRYAVEGEIATGGHATVLLAHDRLLRRPVAIKQLRFQRARSQSRFMNEAFITARLQHPSIVPIYDVGTWPDGTLYFAMELVKGKTLADRIDGAADRRERLSLLPALMAVSDAVAYAHRHRIIHRDLKPANILMSELGETIVIDWGIAVDLSAPEEGPLDEEIGLTPPDRTVVGTPSYMSPEQAAGRRVDERTDVYALGAMLYHLIAGAPPYGEIAPAAVLAAVRERPPAPLPASPEVPPALIRLVDRAMARDPAARYRSAAELRDDLAPALSRRRSDRAPSG